ncbi:MULTISPECIES: hypothetical protein [Streptococcus]|jgi:hypothetical protein|uniref:Uncharacterized protein n=1 Tax=Streptococcus sanguinis SK405 TaxID=888817 RepID=A0ABC9PGT9_STRSA|nr:MULTISPECIES: hypothetical protein [Streptococcus]EGC25043.1 hypothetical protein HMPREF9390_0832 [Streptococcus sanguinis SK405]EGC27486.1 hypothetical protein HMPREF9392_1072 [Streptococcus sanguinis SK678]MCY7015039.1 hypothetical protein [Streptococcus sanguinis]MCY7022971.1 hypothetical protein [Streptococcus sanguinis]MDQ8691793.1 hypothetical protein [Streptococcus sp. IsoGale022]
MKTRYNGGILVKKKIIIVLTILFIVMSGGIYMYNKVTKPNLSPKTAKLYQHGFRLLEEQYGTYFKEHYKGIEKIEFSPVYITGDNGGSMLNAYVRPTIYDKYGNKATLGTTIENYTPNSYGLVTHIFLDFDGSRNDVIELMDSHGNEIDVSNEKHLPDEAKLTKARSTDENISLLVQDGQLKDVVKDEKGSPEAEIIYNVKLSKEEG